MVFAKLEAISDSSPLPINIGLEPHAGKYPARTRQDLSIDVLKAAVPMHPHYHSDQPGDCPGSVLPGARFRAGDPDVHHLSGNTRLTVLPFAIEQGLCAGGAQPPCQGLSGE